MATSTTCRYTHCAKQLAVVAMVVVAQLLLLTSQLLGMEKQPGGTVQPRATVAPCLGVEVAQLLFLLLAVVGWVAELLQAQLKQRLRTGKSSLSRA